MRVYFLEFHSHGLLTLLCTHKTARFPEIFPSMRHNMLYKLHMIDFHDALDRSCTHCVPCHLTSAAVQREGMHKYAL